MQTQTTTAAKPAKIIQNKDPSMADVLARLQALETENAALKAKQASAGKITFKVSEAKPERVENGKKLAATKGGTLCVYGLGRFPTSLYAAQWLRLLAPETVAALLAFIEANRDKLTWKDE